MVFNLTLSGGHIVLELDNTNPVTNPVIENYDRPSFQYDGKTITLCNYGRAIRSLTFDNFGTFTGFDSITTQPTTIQQIADAFSVDIPASGNFNSGGASPQLSADELAAIQGADTPSASNAFATTSAVDDKISEHEGSWVDYSNTATVNGWSIFTTKKILVFIDKTKAIVQWNLEGTSNAQTTNFTIPVFPEIPNRQFASSKSNGTAGAGIAKFNAGLNTVNLFSTVAEAVYSSAGVKLSEGSFTFKLGASSVFAALAGKNLYGFGDSIMANVNATTNIADLAASNLLMTRVKTLNSNNIAVSGSTMMKRTPINALSGSKNFLDWTLSADFPTYNASTDGLVMINYLTNDVGLNLANYTQANLITDFTTAINNVLAKGWPASRIKVLLRYRVTLAGIDYTSLGAGVTVASTLQRYNDMATDLATTATSLGVQSFDFWDTLAALPTPDANLDGLGRHPNNTAHAAAYAQFISQLTI